MMVISLGPARLRAQLTHLTKESLCKHWQYWLAGWLGWLALPTRSQICWTESGAQRSGIEPLAFTTCYHLLPPQPTPDSPSSRVQTPALCAARRLSIRFQRPHLSKQSAGAA